MTSKELSSGNFECESEILFFGVVFLLTLSREALLERNDIVDQMPALLKKLFDRGEVLLLGDTTARVGDLNDGKLIF